MPGLELPLAMRELYLSVGPKCLGSDQLLMPTTVGYLRSGREVGAPFAI